MALDTRASSPRLHPVATTDRDSPGVFGQDPKRSASHYRPRNGSERCIHDTVDQVRDNDDATFMPNSVKASICLCWASALLSVFLASLWVLAVPGVVITAFLTYHIGKARNWARVLLVLWTAMGMYGALYAVWLAGNAFQDVSKQLLLVPLIPKALLCAAACLLFTGLAREWFSEGRERKADAPKLSGDRSSSPASASRAGQARQWLVIPIVVLGSLFLLDRGCKYAWEQVLGGPTDNPTSGDRRYPGSNPRPAQVVQISGFMSRTLPASIDAMYETDWSVSEFNDKTLTWNCARQIFGFHPVPLRIMIPLKLERSGDNYHAILAVDRYLPGECGWHFVGLRIRPLTAPLNDEVTDLFAQAHPHEDTAAYPVNHFYEGPLDLWCHYSPPTQFDASIGCSSLRQVQLNVPHVPALQSMQATNDQSTVFVLPHTKSLQVDFHAF